MQNKNGQNKVKKVRRNGKSMMTRIVCTILVLAMFIPTVLSAVMMIV